MRCPCPAAAILKLKRCHMPLPVNCNRADRLQPICNSDEKNLTLVVSVTFIPTRDEAYGNLKNVY